MTSSVSSVTLRKLISEIYRELHVSKPTITCLISTAEKLEKDAKMLKVNNKDSTTSLYF